MVVGTDGHLRAVYNPELADGGFTKFEQERQAP